MTVAPSTWRLPRPGNEAEAVPPAAPEVAHPLIGANNLRTHTEVLFMLFLLQLGYSSLTDQAVFYSRGEGRGVPSLVRICISLARMGLK